MKVKWAAPAVADLGDIRRYIGKRNPAASRRVVEVIIHAIREVPRLPARGRPGRVPGTRELVVVGTPYLVPYRVRADVIEVLRVLHGARRWPKRL